MLLNWTVVLKKTLESPLDCKEIQPIHPKGDQSWIFIARTDAEVEIPVHAKNWLAEKTLMLGKIDGRRRRGWQRIRWLYGITNSMDMSLSKLQELGSLECCSPWGCKSWTRLSNWIELNMFSFMLVKVNKPTEGYFPVCSMQDMIARMLI